MVYLCLHSVLNSNCRVKKYRSEFKAFPISRDFKDHTLHLVALSCSTTTTWSLFMLLLGAGQPVRFYFM